MTSRRAGDQPERVRRAVEHLRRATRDATDFHVPWTLFQDRLADDSSFLDASVAGCHAHLRRVVEAAVRRLDPSRRFGEAALMRVDDLWHGFVMSSFGLVVFYYFERENVGLSCFLNPSGGSSLLRFSVVELTGAAGAMAGPRGRA